MGHGDGVGASSGTAGNVEVTGCLGNHSDVLSRPCADRARKRKGFAERDMRWQLEPQSFDH